MPGSTSPLRWLGTGVPRVSVCARRMRRAPPACRLRPVIGGMILIGVFRFEKEPDTRPPPAMRGCRALLTLFSSLGTIMATTKCKNRCDFDFSLRQLWSLVTQMAKQPKTKTAAAEKRRPGRPKSSTLDPVEQARVRRQRLRLEQASGAPAWSQPKSGCQKRGVTQ